MVQIDPHINFNGNAEEAFTFYKSLFGGEFTKIIRFKDLSGPEFPVAENEANKIMPMADGPWGSYFGMFRDKFGIEWMVNYAT